MKTKKIKRVLAFFLAVVFAFSTCMTASPYTVQATEEPKLSVNVTLGDGVSTEDLIFDGLNLEFTDRNDQEIGSISIAKEDLGTTKTTEILYSKISDISNIIITDTKQLYTVTTSEADFDDETHAAHNSTTNKTKAKTIAFTVDKTAPTMVVSNLTDRGRYKENMHEFTLNVKDNIFLAYVEVYLDGELFKRFEEDEIAQLNGELPVDIASSNQYQTIELVSCDKAGNISKEVYDPETNAQVPASYRVLVTQNSFVQFINNTPLLVSVIVIIVAIAGLIVVLVKRKKDKEK